MVILIVIMVTAVQYLLMVNVLHLQPVMMVLPVIQALKDPVNTLTLAITVMAVLQMVISQIVLEQLHLTVI